MTSSQTVVDVPILSFARAAGKWTLQRTIFPTLFFNKTLEISAQIGYYIDINKQPLSG